LEQSSLAPWQLSEEVDVSMLPSVSLSSSYSVAFATPTQTSATLEGASATLVAQALQQSQNTTTQGRPGMGNREADGGWCISWCKDRYWGEIIATGCGISGVIKVLLQCVFSWSCLIWDLSDYTTVTVSSTSDSPHFGPVSFSGRATL